MSTRVAPARARVSTAPVRFGLIGCGRMGALADERAMTWPVARWWLPLSHACAISASPGAVLAAVCDVDGAAAKGAMHRHGAKAWYQDYRHMLEQEQLDAVAIATRTPDRCAILEACVQHGIRAVYCEKPLCNSLEDADAMARLFAERGVSFLYGTRRRFMPVYDAVRREVERGAIGTLTTIVIRFGTGGLFWTHPHSVDIASFFAGDAAVDTVQATLDLDPSRVSGSVVDADPVVRMGALTFANGISVHVVAGDSYDVELLGTAGMATIRSDGAAVHWRTPSDAHDQGWFMAERVTPGVRASSGTTVSIETLIALVREGRSPGYTIQLAVQHLEVLFGWVESHLAGGARIRLPLERRGVRITGRTGERYA